jgi:hypothetical protein
MPNLFDTIELIVDIPENRLNVGMRGTIVECLSNDAYEVEFINNYGETTNTLPLYQGQFIVVWRSDTKEWVTLSEKVANLVASLPEDAGTEVLDFAKFLYWQRQRNGISYIQQEK